MGFWGTNGTADLADLINVDQAIDLTADTVYNAYIEAAIFVLPTAFGTVSGSASVDPMFAIDPSFALANPGYSIEYSSNLVPETTSTLGLVALSAVGILMLRFIALTRWMREIAREQFRTVP